MIFEKKVPFATLFPFFINVFFSFRSNLKCMDEVNYFFIVDLSLFLIFNLFLLFVFFHKKQSRFASFFLCFNLLRREPFCLASVAFGIAFPGHWSGSCSGALRRRCLCVPCP